MNPVEKAVRGLLEALGMDPEFGLEARVDDLSREVKTAMRKHAKDCEDNATECYAELDDEGGQRWNEQMLAAQEIADS